MFFNSVKEINSLRKKYQGYQVKECQIFTYLF